MNVWNLTSMIKTPARPAKPFRHELKFLINEGERELLKTRMRPLFQLDPHAVDGQYLIRSLYFDDYWNSAYEEKDMGVMERQKYRIRLYNCQDDVIQLERKRKSGSYIFKESARLTRDEVERILRGEYAFLLQHPSPVTLLELRAAQKYGDSVCVPRLEETQGRYTIADGTTV